MGFVCIYMILIYIYIYYIILYYVILYLYLYLYLYSSVIVYHSSCCCFLFHILGNMTWHTLRTWRHVSSIIWIMSCGPQIRWVTSCLVGWTCCLVILAQNWMFARLSQILDSFRSVGIWFYLELTKNGGVMVACWWYPESYHIPSGKPTQHHCGKSPFFDRYINYKWVIFNSYVGWPEAKTCKWG